VSGWEVGARRFNAGAYWEAHEAWEGPWGAAHGLDRSLYAGAILLAAALHKARAMGNARGGRRNYAKALAHLALLPDHYRGVAVRALEAQVHAALQEVALAPQLPLALESEPADAARGNPETPCTTREAP
jgi:predicted metal-dependent hydrolase